MVLWISLLTLLIWICLIFFRDGYWRANQRLDAWSPAPTEWPRIVAVIPARNEAETIGAVLESHLAAVYPGAFSVIIVDDNSTDDTAARARAAAEKAASNRVVDIIDGAPLPDGWTGKLWAQHQGVAAAKTAQADYLLLCDADIVFSPDALRRLVQKAVHERLDLASLMARLDARGFWGGLLIPAFVYFFQKLYPFSVSNNPTRNTAAAAGGCMLVRAEALEAVGGVSAMRNALIDDCTLARRIKDARPGGRIWLGLAEDEARSLRDNRSLGSVWNMVARTAYAQLDYSPSMLFGAILGMILTYLAAPAIALTLFAHGHWTASLIALIAWWLMAYSYWPTLRLYGGELWQALLLPFAALLYTMMTVHSAVRHAQGKGGQWKGRSYSSG
ncbi:MAG: glycosyltransferase [Pseudomonadota bacterium]